jgi:hypothetical protein
VAASESADTLSVTRGGLQIQTKSQELVAAVQPTDYENTGTMQRFEGVLLYFILSPLQGWPV